VTATYTADQVKSAFRAFEGNGPKGHIKVEHLVKALTTYGSERVTEEQALELVGQLEPDQNGYINYIDYVNMMMTD